MDSEDKDYFQQSILGAKPLDQRHKKTHVHQKRIQYRKRQDSSDPEPLESGLPLNYWQLDEVTVDAKQQLEYRSIKFSKKQWRQFIQGAGNVRNVLDLHGFSREDAWDAVQMYIDQLYCSNQRYGLIVHGKGHYSKDGVAYLKNMLASHLPQHPQVLAYCSAMPKDGGTGAIYIFIRSNR